MSDYTPLFTYIYIYIYIVIHKQTDCFVLLELVSVANQVWRSKPGSKPIQLYVRLSLRPLGQQAYHVGWENFKVLCSNSSSSRLFTFLYPIGYQRAQSFRRALHYASGHRKFLRQSAQPPWGSVYIYMYVYIYIYIYIYTKELWKINRYIYIYIYLCFYDGWLIYIYILIC